MKQLAAGLLFALAAGLVSSAAPVARRASRVVYVGTYTNANTTSKGIYGFRFDDANGALTPMGLAVETTSPSFLATSQDGRFVFAVNESETYGGASSGSVSSFAVDAATNKLRVLSVQPSRGADPCHLMLDRTGKFLAVANYTGGNFAMFPVGADGKLGPAATVFAGRGSGPNKDRQAGPHAHEVVFDPANKFLIGADLGIDRLLVYRFDAATGRVTPNTPPSAALPAGAGPRHFVFHPDGRMGYAINELGSTITSFAWDATSGRLTTGKSVSTVPAGFTGTNSTAEIAIHPNGQFLYGSNRGHDSIAVFAIGASGALTLVERAPTRGKTPRNFSIDSSGRWLVAGNQDSNTLAVFSVNGQTGKLTPAGALTDVSSPVSVLFMP